MLLTYPQLPDKHALVASCLLDFGINYPPSKINGPEVYKTCMHRVKILKSSILNLRRSNIAKASLRLRTLATHMNAFASRSHSGLSPSLASTSFSLRVQLVVERREGGHESGRWLQRSDCSCVQRRINLLERERLQLLQRLQVLNR